MLETTSRDGVVPVVGLDLPAIPESVGAVRREVRAFAAECGAGADLQHTIALAVSEAVTNAVIHAYRDGPPGQVHVDTDYDDGVLEIAVYDDGLGLGCEPGPGIGLGLLHMSDAADQFEIRDRPGGGVEVWLGFALP